ncbi:MAG: hypothetical protein C4557_04255 [Anaerolineaceae bacterium]|jgi:hypothetical protein|nr:MAG: hypothetical protein C4557_04255 [Anaerolineaceae bacterium]
MKTFLKPSLAKSVVTILLFVFSSWLWRMYVTSTISDTFPHGFPLQYYLGWGPCPPGRVCSEFNGWYLAFDLIFWYFVSAFIVTKFWKNKN